MIRLRFASSVLATLALTALAPLASADTPLQAPAPAPVPAPAPAPAPGGVPMPSIPGLPPFQLPPFAWPQIPGVPAGPGGAPASPSGAPGSAASPGLLPPLFGALSWQGEVRSVINELEAHLSPENQARVRGIPLIIDPNPNTINAFAGCDEKGAPFLAGTEGLLEAIDAIAQTTANDDLFGTHTYDQYTNTVMPQLVRGSTASPALPLGVLPFMTALDPRRLSRAHELFDSIVAFTFAHELSHHYLGHTGCANGGGSGGLLVDPGAIVRLVTRVPLFNQPLESAADTAGTINVLDTGRARRPSAAWTERGGLLMLDFFARLDAAAGMSPMNPIGFLQTHPHPAFRIPIVQATAQYWRQTHPG